MNENQQIPKIIHQIWFKFGNGPEQPPVSYQEMIASWRKVHPDWTFLQWNLENARQLLIDNYPSFVKVFDSYRKPIYKCDAIRYFILHHYGGFYVDTDITCYKSIDELRYNNNVIPLNKYTKKMINNNHFIGAVKNSNFMKECIEKLPISALFQLESNSYLSTMSVAGPFFLTSIYQATKNKKDIYILDDKKESKLMNHHEAHSWKLASSVFNDVVRSVVLTGGIILSGLFVKKVSDRIGSK